MVRAVKIPVVHDKTITLGEMVGVDKHRSSVWRLHCQCGHHFDVPAPRIKKGWYRCGACDPKPGDVHPQAIMAVLPATGERIAEATGLTHDQVKHRLSIMRNPENKRVFVLRWVRNRSREAVVPVFAIGSEPDAEQPPKQSTATYSKRYRRRVSTAIRRAREGKKYDERYAHLVGIALAKDNAARTRINPQHWFSALGL